MAKRQIKRPGIEDLSKEQEDGRALPLDGQHLIIGGPGTGKSVLALLRARRLHNENRAYIFLVYNHLLNQSSRNFFGKELVSRQWQSWFFQIFRELTGKTVPRLPALPGSSWQPILWEITVEIAAATEEPKGSERLYLIIDEGQDMPPGFYHCLANLGFTNIFVVADQNQQITEENSSIADLRNALALDPEEVIELKMNYRNKYSVARLAREFYTGDPASPPPELPPPPPIQAKVPMLYMYPPDKFSGVIRRIAKMADRMPSKLLGVIAPDNRVREQFFNALKAVKGGLDNGSPNVSTFYSGDRREMAFDEGGVMVINAQACKGLEFDIVFVVGLHDFRIGHNSRQQAQRLFYVMIARAIDTVIMLQDKDRHCPAEAILPTDTQILERF